MGNKLTKAKSSKDVHDNMSGKIICECKTKIWSNSLNFHMKMCPCATTCDICPRYLYTKDMKQLPVTQYMLCHKCFTLIKEQYLTLMMVINRTNITLPRDLCYLLLEHIVKDTEEIITTRIRLSEPRIMNAGEMGFI